MWHSIRSVHGVRQTLQTSHILRQPITLQHLSPVGVQPIHRLVCQPRSFSTTSRHLQQQQPRPNFYRTHGRAFLKTFTLAFLTYQIIYWYWLTISNEEVMDEKKAQIEELKSEVKLLDEGRGSHKARLLEEDGTRK